MERFEMIRLSAELWWTMSIPWDISLQQNIHLSKLHFLLIHMNLTMGNLS